MNNYINYLPEYLSQAYSNLKPSIIKRLEEFKKVPKSKYFYEMCFCICTPQSRAKSALEVQYILEGNDFKNKGFDPTPILRDSKHYIRFHNQKAKRLMMLREYFPKILELLESSIDSDEKRKLIYERVTGFGLKESAHFLRNIGYEEMAILDRHILKHLVMCGVYDEIPKINSIKQYSEVESKFRKFSHKVGISIDELDLLFWSYETGEILK